MKSLPTPEEVLAALSVIEDPDFHRNIVELGFVQELQISAEGLIRFDLVLTTPACPVKDKFVADCEQILLALAGVLPKLK